MFDIVCVHRLSSAVRILIVVLYFCRYILNLFLHFVISDLINGDCKFAKHAFDLYFDDWTKAVAMELISLYFNLEMKSFYNFHDII